LADAFSKMPRDQAYTLAKQMGLDDGTFNTLVQGRKELQEILDIQKRMYHSDGEAIARSRELTKQQAILSAHWQSMKQLVGDALTPILLTLIKVVNSFFEFLQRHEKVIKAVFQTAAIVIGTLLIPTLLSAGRALLGFVAPFAPAIAAVTALAGAFLLLYDDYDTWAKGGKSLFDWGAFSTAIKGIKISVDTLCTAFGNMVKAVKNNAIPALKSYAEAVGILAHDDYNGSDKQVEQAEQAKQVEQTKKVEQAKKAEQTKQVKQAKQTKKVSGTFSDIVIGAIADATGQKKEDVADFVGESMYKLFHGGKDYFEQNSTQKPVKANTSRGSVAKGSVTESKGSFAQELNAAMDRYGIKDAKARASFLSNVDNETGGGKKLTENPNFSLKRWRELAGNQKNIRNWLNAHKDNQEAAFKALSQQDKVNIMYNKMIGNKYADDPWKFRGRGGMQLTGRANYQAYADYSGRQDIMSNPDLIATDPRLAADSAAWFFMKRSKAGQQAQAGDIAGARKTVNGGTIGMNNYMRLYGQYLQGKGVLSNNNIQENALKAQSMIAYGQRMQTAPVTHNDNRKYVNVNIPNMNVNTSSNTVSGNTVAAMKEVQNYTFNQLGVSMT
ncbi:putative chitinase, partial [Snodgrassella alvi SCGC AB-598-P14]